jgi:hypothetical protein
MFQDMLHFVIQPILSNTPGTDDDLSRVTPDRYILHDKALADLVI